MLSPHTETHTMTEYHNLSDKWTLWAHLPHDTDWSIKSYKNIYTVSFVEETISLVETLQDILIKNCMLFFMRDGIKPIWEEPKIVMVVVFHIKYLKKMWLLLGSICVILYQDNQLVKICLLLKN